MRTITCNGNTVPEGLGLLGPEEIDMSPWGSLSHQNYLRNVCVVAVGSPVRLLEDAYLLLEWQRMSPNGVAALIGGATTPHDLSRLVQLTRGRSPELRTSRGLFIRRDVIHPNSCLALTRNLGHGAFQGCGSDQQLAVARLQGDPLLREELDEVAECAVNDLRRHRLSSFTGVWDQAFGGSDPFAQYLRRRVTKRMPQNLELELRLLPSAEELLNCHNARGALYNAIKRPIPENALVITKEQASRGPQYNDQALVAGLLALSGSSPANRSPDAASLVRMLRHAGSGWVDVRPAVVPIALAKLERRAFFWRRRYGVLPPDGEGPGLWPVLNEVRTSLTTEPDAFHVVVIGGCFTDSHRIQLEQSIVAMCGAGHVVPVVAGFFPRVRNNLAEFLVCTFTSAPQLPGSVVSLFSRGDTLYRRRGFTPEEFLDTVQEPVEARVAAELESALDLLCVPRG